MDRHLVGTRGWDLTGGHLGENGNRPLEGNTGDAWGLAWGRWEQIGPLRGLRKPRHFPLSFL